MKAKFKNLSYNQSKNTVYNQKFKYNFRVGDTIRPYSVYRNTFIGDPTNKILTNKITIEFIKNSNSNGVEIFIDKVRLTFFPSEFYNV
jgi:hypothetical protein